MKSVNLTQHIPTYSMLRQIDKVMAEVFICYLISANAYRHVVLPDRVLAKVLNLSKRKVHESKRGLLNLKAIERSPFFPIVNGKEQVLRVRKPAQTVVHMLSGFGFSEADTLAELKRIALNQFAPLEANDPYQLIVSADSDRPENATGAVWNEAVTRGGSNSLESMEPIERNGVSGNHRMPVPVNPQNLSSLYMYMKNELELNSECNKSNTLSSPHTYKQQLLSVDATVVPKPVESLQFSTGSQVDDCEHSEFITIAGANFPELGKEQPLPQIVAGDDEPDAPQSSTEAKGAVLAPLVEVAHHKPVETASKADSVPFDKRNYNPDLGLAGEAAKKNALRKKILGVMDGWNVRAKTLGLNQVFLSKKERNGDMPIKNKKLAEQISLWLDEYEDEWIEAYKVALERLNNGVCLGEAVGSFRAFLGWMFNTAYEKGRGVDRLLCGDYMTKDEPSPYDVAIREYAKTVFQRCKSKGIESFYDSGVDPEAIASFLKPDTDPEKAKEALRKTFHEVMKFDHDYLKIEMAKGELTPFSSNLQKAIYDFALSEENEALFESEATRNESAA